MCLQLGNVMPRTTKIFEIMPFYHFLSSKRRLKLSNRGICLIQKLCNLYHTYEIENYKLVDYMKKQRRILEIIDLNV